MTSAEAARLRRLNRWKLPLTTPWLRLRAWANMLLVDHGIIRLFHLNRHQIAPMVWRSAQPFPHHLRQFARQGGRSVVSLRGGQTFGSLPLEREACARARLSFQIFVLRSRSIPSVEELRAAEALLKTLDYPVLFHCKSGADRAGFMSALYMALIEGVPVAEARRQLSLRFGHIRQGKTGILDAFFDQYEADTGGEIPLMEWVETQYDRDALTASFRPSPLGGLITDVLLRRE